MNLQERTCTARTVHIHTVHTYLAQPESHPAMDESRTDRRVPLRLVAPKLVYIKTDLQSPDEWMGGRGGKVAAAIRGLSVLVWLRAKGR